MGLAESLQGGWSSSRGSSWGGGRAESAASWWAPKEAAPRPRAAQSAAALQEAWHDRPQRGQKKSWEKSEEGWGGSWEENSWKEAWDGGGSGWWKEEDHASDPWRRWTSCDGDGRVTRRGDTSAAIVICDDVGGTWAKWASRGGSGSGTDRRASSGGRE